MLRDMMYLNRDDDIWLIDNTSTANVEYWGYAAPGSATSSQSWKLIKVTKDSSGLMISKLFANATPAYVNIWDNRTSITNYS